MISARRLGAATVLALVAISTLPSLAGGDPRFDRSLAVEILPGSQYSDDRLRRQVGRELVRRLAGSDCFTAVQLIDRGDDPTPPSQDLLLQVRIDGVELSTDYGTTQAAQADPDRLPETSTNLVARVEVYYSVALTTADGIALSSRDGMKQVSTYRPRHTENAQEMARTNALFEVARTSQRFACTGSAKKLEKALAAAGERAPAR